MIRKKLIICLLSLTLLLIFNSYALSAIPNLANTTWQGSAKQVTLTGCSNVDIVFYIAEQCGSLFRGFITYSTQPSIDVVGKIGESESSILIVAQGLESNASAYRTVALSGNYVAGPPPFILVGGFGFLDINLSFSQNLEFDSFMLFKQ